jgi:hypothetical protein
MIEGIALARLLVKFKKLLRITDAEFVIPTRHFMNKRVIELQSEFIEQQSKAKAGSVGKMGMTAREEEIQLVREVLAVMHPGAQTLEDIGIAPESKVLLAQANVTCWASMIEDVGSSSHRLDCQTKRNAAEFHRRLGEDDNQEFGSERSADREKAYRALQVRKLLMKGNDAKEPSSAEEVDLGYTDLAESDPAHHRQAHANKRLSPQWTVEEGLFERGCLQKVKKNDLQGHESLGRVGRVRRDPIITPEMTGLR